MPWWYGPNPARFASAQVENRGSVLGLGGVVLTGRFVVGRTVGLTVGLVDVLVGLRVGAWVRVGVRVRATRGLCVLVADAVGEGVPDERLAVGVSVGSGGVSTTIPMTPRTTNRNNSAPQPTPPANRHPLLRRGGGGKGGKPGGCCELPYMGAPNLAGARPKDVAARPSMPHPPQKAHPYYLAGPIQPCRVRRHTCSTPSFAPPSPSSSALVELTYSSSTARLSSGTNLPTRLLSLGTVWPSPKYRRGLPRSAGGKPVRHEQPVSSGLGPFSRACYSPIFFEYRVIIRSVETTVPGFGDCRTTIQFRSQRSIRSCPVASFSRSRKKPAACMMFCAFW